MIDTQLDEPPRGVSAGERMNNLLQLSIFSTIKDMLVEISEAVQNAKLIQLMAPADLDGILALSQLEASFLDNSIHYRRRVLAPRKHEG